MSVFPKIPRLWNIPFNPLTLPLYLCWTCSNSTGSTKTEWYVLGIINARWNVRISCTSAVFPRTQKNVQRRGSQTFVKWRWNRRGTRFGVCALHFDDDWLKARLPDPSFEVCGNRPYIFSAAAIQERAWKYRSPNFLLLLLLLLWSQLWGDSRWGRGTLWPKCIMYVYIYWGGLW